MVCKAMLRAAVGVVLVVMIAVPANAASLTIEGQFNGSKIVGMLNSMPPSGGSSNIRDRIGVFTMRNEPAKAKSFLA